VGRIQAPEVLLRRGAGGRGALRGHGDDAFQKIEGGSGRRPFEFAARFLAAEMAKWEPIIRAAGIKPN
jgi:hypothetical protein